MAQSTEEVLRIFDEWGRHYAPSNFIQNEKNATLLAGYVFKTYGLVSITYLNLAASALASQLDLVPEKKAPTKAELAEKENSRQHRDWLKSLEPQTTLYRQKLGQSRLDENKKAANEKEFKTVLSQIEREISEHVRGHASGHQDYSRTASERDTLRSVRDQHNRSTIVAAKSALAAVRAAKAKL